MTGRGRGERAAPRPIGETLEDAIGRASPRGKRLLAILVRWRDMVSPATLEHACPTSISRDVLRLTVTDPIWMSELSYFLPSFVAAFNEVLPDGEKIAGIRLRLGQVPAGRRAVGAGVEPPPSRTAPADKAAIPQRVRARLERIADPELRDMIARVAAGLSSGRR